MQYLVLNGHLFIQNVLIYYFFYLYCCIFNIYSFLLAQGGKELDQKVDIQVIFKLYSIFFSSFTALKHTILLWIMHILFLHTVSLWFIVNLLLPQPLEMQSWFIPPVRVIVQISKFHNALTATLVFIFNLISLLHSNC